MRYRYAPYLFFLLFLIGSISDPPSTGAEELSDSIGRVFSLTFHDLLGHGEITTNDEDGLRRGTLVVFWSSECGPCLREIPVLNGLYAKWAGRGLEIIGIPQDERPESVIAISHRFGITWPQYLESGMPFEKPLTAQWRIGRTPTFLLLDPSGTVVDADFDDPDAAWENYLASFE